MTIAIYNTITEEYIESTYEPTAFSPEYMAIGAIMHHFKLIPSNGATRYDATYQLRKRGVCSMQTPFKGTQYFVGTDYKFDRKVYTIYQIG